MDTPTDRPGYLDASAYVDTLASIEDAASAQIAATQYAYHEIERRDGSAQWWASRFFRFACVVTVALLVSLSVNIYQMMQARQVQAFVQTVQVTEEGRLVQVGIPMDLLAYAPEDSQWMDMLAQWVTKRRWKGDDEQLKRTRNDWAWLYRHTCGAASKFLEGEEVKEQPFKPTKKRVSIEVKSITKTTTPASYQVVWYEVSIDPLASTTKQDYIGTFTVGRVRPKTLAEAIDNRLGLCVNGYDLRPSAGKDLAQ